MSMLAIRIFSLEILRFVILFSDLKKNGKMTWVIATLKSLLVSRQSAHKKVIENVYAAVNGKLELTLLKGRQRFDTVSTSNLKV